MMCKVTRVEHGNCACNTSRAKLGSGRDKSGSGHGHHPRDMLSYIAQKTLETFHVIKVNSSEKTTSPDLATQTETSHSQHPSPPQTLDTAE